MTTKGARLTMVGGVLALGAISFAQVPASTLRFTGTDRNLALIGPYASLRVLVEEQRAGQTRDVSAEAVYTVGNPAIAVLREGTLWPRKDGVTVLTARVNKATVTIPVLVKGISGAKPPRFTTDVLPVLTRNGCNQGACHGAAQGKGGFKLSLQGYDPEADYETLTRAAAGRRVSPAQPENSLLLRKPTLAVSHRGGKLFEVGSPAYRLLTDWIAGGMPAPEPTEPGVAALEVVPPQRILAVGQKQRFRVLASFTDGTRRDITEDALFSVSDGTVTRVSPDGLANVVGKGEGAILIRYRDRVATAAVLSPFAKPVAPPARSATRIDRLVDNKLAALGLPASARCSDADFLRRVSLDLIGLLPNPAEVRAFLADTDPQKRTRLVDALLQRPEYVDFWALKWGDILRSNRNLLNDKGLTAFNHWIRASVAENKPWDRFARELLLAQGSMYEEGPANYFRAATTPETLAETTSQVFLGVRMQCAKCHNHPYERWKQTQYYQLAAFFARVRTKAGEVGDERVVYTTNSGEVTNPKTRQTVVPTALDAEPLAPSFAGDRRAALADWLTGPQNPFFARILVNRVWKHFLGQGLVEPVDDMRVTNPPSNAALLEFLAQDFVQHDYNVQYLIHSIVATDVYQRSALPTRGNGADTRYYSHFFFKRLGAEQLLDAVGTATGVPEKFAGYPVGMRATELPDTTVQSYFLDLFGRPARNISCQCERLDAPNLGQILHFMNGKSINTRLAAREGRIAQLLAAKTPPVPLIEELYLATLSRYPEEGEMLEAYFDLNRQTDKQKAGEDLLWALLNSKEFVFNH